MEAKTPHVWARGSESHNPINLTNPRLGQGIRKPFAESLSGLTHLTNIIIETKAQLYLTLSGQEAISWLDNLSQEVNNKDLN